MAGEYVSGKKLMELYNWDEVHLGELVREGLPAYFGLNRIPIVDLNSCERVFYFENEGQATTWLNLYWDKDRDQLEDLDYRALKLIFDTFMQRTASSQQYTKSTYREEFFYFLNEFEGVYSKRILNPLMKYVTRRIPKNAVAVDFNEKQPIHTWAFKVDEVSELVRDEIKGVDTNSDQDKNITLCLGIVDEGEINGRPLKGNERRNILVAAQWSKCMPNKEILNEVEERADRQDMGKICAVRQKGKIKHSLMADWREEGYRLLKKHGIELKQCEKKNKNQK